MTEINHSTRFVSDNGNEYLVKVYPDGTAGLFLASARGMTLVKGHEGRWCVECLPEATEEAAWEAIAAWDAA